MEKINKGENIIIIKQLDEKEYRRNRFKNLSEEDNEKKRDYGRNRNRNLPDNKK